LSSVCFAAGFPDCFPSEPLARFWQDESYVSSNPNIISVWSIRSYSFAFDNSTQSLELANVSIMNGSALLARVPAGQRGALSEPASLLTQASGELALAKEASLSAHGLSSRAHAAVRDSFGLQNLPLTNVFFLSAVINLDTLLKVAEVSKFISLYPAQYSSALGHAASAHDSLQLAALALSRLAQDEYEFLSRAGAGSPAYSGAASPAFNYAESLLAPEGGFCAGEAAAYRRAYDYFASSPQLPDFAQAGLQSRLDSLGGAGENSSIARTLSLYSLLSEAREKMLSEYSTGQLYAKDSLRALSLELSLLGGEKLELIGDLPPPAEGESLLVLGGSTGIYSGYLAAKDGSLRAQALLSSSQASFSSKEADGWLSQAISESQSSSELSQSSLLSLKAVRSNAEAAVLSQKGAAEGAIEAARHAASSEAASLPSAHSLSAARSLLSQAEESFLSSGALPSLGARYQAYSGARRLADRAVSISQGSQASGALLAAEEGLSRYSSLLSLARADGIDVAYEQEALASYRALISQPASWDIISSVSLAAESDRRALILRVYESYRYLEEKYESACLLSTEMLSYSPSLSQKLSGIGAYFPSGALDAERAMGRLKQTEREIDSVLASAWQQAPQYLSSALAQNSHLSEAYSTPVLGRQTDYSAYISTSNPSGLSSSGAIPFFLRTSVPLYSTDFSGGDAISDAYPDKGKTAIVIPSVAPRQSFSFTFEKKDQPVQILSAEDACSFASEEIAYASRTISFVSSRAVSTLLLSQSAPALSHSAAVQYSGQKLPISSFSTEGGGLLQGEIYGVPAGKGELTIFYSVPSPFSASPSGREYETLPLGAKEISYTLSLSPPLLDCPSAMVYIHEPYGGIFNLSIAPLSGEKVARASAAASGNETQISFSLSPLARGKPSSFSVSYVVQDASQALSAALSQAELLVLTYNRSRDALMLSEARRLALSGSTNEALSLLSQMRKEAQELSYSEADYRLFLQEKSDADGAVFSLSAAQKSLALADSPSLAAFSSALFKYQSSISSASGEADAGGYQKALSALRKAKADLYSSLSALSLSSLKSASEGYASARKQGAADSPLLSAAQGALSEAQASYTDGDFTQSLAHSSSALSSLSAFSQASSASASEIAGQAESLRSGYASLREGTEPLLANYSSQYSALSVQSRRQLPFTPAAAAARLSEADKQLAASKKPSLPPQEALSEANASYGKLSSLHASLSNALESLSSSASSALDVARAALSEVKARASAEDASQIGDEVARAEAFLSGAMYADSLASSDRAIRAANAALSKAGAGGSPLQPAALALVSIVFLAGAAYYFFSGKKRAPPGEKKEVPKAE
jgi:hypothetical protein